MKFYLILAVIFYFGRMSAGQVCTITQCSGGKFPSSVDPNDGSYTSTDSSGAVGYLIEEPMYQVTCCGVVSAVEIMAGRSGDLQIQIWRKLSESSYTLKGKYVWTVPDTGHQNQTIPDEERLSVRHGDYIGWYGDGIVNYDSPGSGNVMNRKASTGHILNEGDTFAWDTQEVLADRTYAIRYTTIASTAPYFENLPATVTFADTSVILAGQTLFTVAISDIDKDDVTGIRKDLNPEWNDYFTFDTSTGILTNAQLLNPGSYDVTFYAMDECYTSNTEVLTVIVTDTAPVITTLPASATVREDNIAETLLHTLTIMDASDDIITCDESWTVGEPVETPIMVKKIHSTLLRYGIYLMAWPNLDYDTDSKYDLTIHCRDATTTVTGPFTVNVIQNEAPQFSNIDNAVSVDATTAIIGTVIFTVYTTDSEGDQVRLTMTGCSAPCPFQVYNSGEVSITENIYLWDVTSYTVDIFAHDQYNSNIGPFTLSVYIRRANNQPVVTAPGSVNVNENSALGTSVYQTTATDADSETLSYSMSVDPGIGYRLFQINASTGLVSTSSSTNIDFDILPTPTFTMTIYSHDGKEFGSNTLTINVINVNEAPVFHQSSYRITDLEGTALTQLNDAQFTIIDPDDTSFTFSLDCGTTLTSRFTIDTNGRVSYVADYDLDTGDVTDISCTVTVTDDDGATGTANLYLNISYKNEFDPTFSPASYAFDVETTSVIGATIFRVTATDADASTDGVFQYTLDQTNLGDTYFSVTNAGYVYVIKDISTFTSGTTQTITVTATNPAELTSNGNANIDLTFILPTTVTTTTIVRHLIFIEDTHNVAWLIPSSMAGLALLIVIKYLCFRYIKMKNKECEKEISFCPCLDYSLPRKLDRNRRWMPIPKAPVETQLYEEQNERRYQRSKVSNNVKSNHKRRKRGGNREDENETTSRAHSKRNNTSVAGSDVRDDSSDWTSTRRAKPPTKQPLRKKDRSEQNTTLPKSGRDSPNYTRAIRTGN